VIKNFQLTLMILLCIVTLPTYSGQTEKTATPVVVMIDKGPSGFIYKVNSKVTKEILATLTRIKASDSNPHPKSILIVHEDVTLTMINGMRGVMSKAGFVYPDQRVYFFNRDGVKDVMTEITFSPPLRFSEKGETPEGR
jgi:hypothetical protein